MLIEIKPVGIVKTNFSDEEVKNAWLTGGVKGVIEVFPEFKDALDGIDGFSHIILVAWLHKVKPSERTVLRVKHRRLTRLGVPLEALPEVGVFCTDSPHRPNPIGISIVKLERRSGRLLYVSGLDLFNGTPIIDIKAYTPDRSIKGLKVPRWYRELEELVRRYGGGTFSANIHDNA